MYHISCTSNFFKETISLKYLEFFFSTGSTEIKNEKITIYPNPVKNSEFFISGINKNETVKIYILTGQLLQIINNVNNKEKMNLNKLPRGVYFVTTKSQSAKMIVD